MSEDRITEITIRGMRCVKDLTLPLTGMNVLIGDNGSGKSTIVEACEILRKSMHSDFYNYFHSVHGGFPAMGNHQVDVGVRIAGTGSDLLYEFTMAQEGRETAIDSETLQVLPESEPSWIFLKRGRAASVSCNPMRNRPTELKERVASHPNILLLLTIFNRNPVGVVARAVNALQGIEVHIPFEVKPDWVARMGNLGSRLRDSTILQPAEKLDLLGNNIASVYFSLKNDMTPEHWSETLEYVRLGLGDDIEDLGFNVDQAGGRVAIKIKFRSMQEWVASGYLSDGMLSYLAMVAIFRLKSNRSLLAFDEPDLHLHPKLAMRVLDMFESMAKDHPVLIATHSDQFLDGLTDPAGSTVVCELDQERQTRVRRLDKKLLEGWLERYRGFGDIRAAGHEASVLEPGDD